MFLNEINKRLQKIEEILTMLKYLKFSVYNMEGLAKVTTNNSEIKMPELNFDINNYGLE